MLVSGSCPGEHAIPIDPQAFRLLFALHETELKNALGFLQDDARHFSKFKSLQMQDCYDWETAKKACAKENNWHDLVFVLAHSDGDWLELANSKIDCEEFADMLLMNRREDGAELILLNCCMSAAGGEQRSLLTAVADDGFCGLVGAEAELLNTYAIRCGTRLLWGLCAEGLNLGEAFDAMQRAPDLFPLNLFYTCYAQRQFQLLRPIDDLKAV
jgi:hypothetical protein